MARITDVARRAGVSPSTVSYALSGKRPISAATRRRVEAAARELGYRPPPAGSPTGVLGLLLPPPAAGPWAPAVTACAMSVVTAARAHGHDVLLISREEGERSPHRPVDALIVPEVGPRDPRLPWWRGRPAVLIGVPAEPAGLTCVDLDFRAAGERCVTRLAELGHRVVALVAGAPEGSARGAASAHRVARGCTAAAGRAGLVMSAHPGAGTPAAVRDTAERLLRLRPAPTAIVVHGDPLPALLVDAFAHLGRRVPDDLSVVAVCPDDAARAARPPVTSVAVPSAELGALAVDLAVRAIAGAAAPGVTLLPPRLTDRASTAPPAAGRTTGGTRHRA